SAVLVDFIRNSADGIGEDKTFGIAESKRVRREGAINIDIRNDARAGISRSATEARSRGCFLRKKNAGHAFLELNDGFLSAKLALGPAGIDGLANQIVDSRVKVYFDGPDNTLGLRII